MAPKKRASSVLPESKSDQKSAAPEFGDSETVLESTQPDSESVESVSAAVDGDAPRAKRGTKRKSDPPPANEILIEPADSGAGTGSGGDETDHTAGAEVKTKKQKNSAAAASASASANNNKRKGKSAAGKKSRSAAAAAADDDSEMADAAGDDDADGDGSGGGGGANVSVAEMTARMGVSSDSDGESGAGGGDSKSAAERKRPPSDPNKYAESGVITRIELRNFLCHRVRTYRQGGSSRERFRHPLSTTDPPLICSLSLSLLRVYRTCMWNWVKT